MNLKTRFSTAIVAMLAAITITLTGCTPEYSPDGDAPDSVVIVVGTHQGMPQAKIPVELVDALTAATMNTAPLSVIGVDGTPERIFRSDGYEVNNANEQSLADDVNAQLTALIAAVQSATADSDGNNLGAALSIAADQVRADDAHNALIIVIDNGISDRGFPNITSPGMTTTSDTTALRAFAKEHDYLTEYPTGSTAVLVGFGYTASPQADITGTQRENIVGAWSALLEEGGAEVVALTTPRSGEGPSTTFTTGTVEPQAYDDLVISDKEAQLAADVLFDSGSAQLRADTRTEDALRALAEHLSGYDGPLTVNGYTDAIGDDPMNLALGAARARTIADWLIRDGVATQQQLSTCGFGERSPAVPDATTDAEHQANRRVVIVREAAPC